MIIKKFGALIAGKRSLLDRVVLIGSGLLFDEAAFGYIVTLSGPAWKRVRQKGDLEALARTTACDN